ncbi:dynein light chain 1, axonemal, partial [Clarias magur]
MAKSTTIKEALSKWEEKSGEKAGDAKEVKLYGQVPPIEKMDASLSTLTNCEKLSLSTNCIEKIANLNGLKNLKILSLGRNNIKNLNGLEAIADTLEELWISYNLIDKLKGIHVMKKLRVLYMSNNLVKEWGEFVKLAELSTLVDLVFVGNPLEEKYSTEGTWIDEATKRVPNLKKLDGAQFRFVQSALWHSGYGGWWVVGPRACDITEEIGSRDLLLAFSWLIASGNLLEALLRDRLLELDVLSSAAGGLPKEPELDLKQCEEKDLRMLQWQYGKLKLQWRNLLTAQQEQAKLADKVCVHMSSPPSSHPGTVHVPNLSTSTALEKDLQRTRSLNGILEAYLEWKNMEPLFWCWMDSVIDGYLSDGYQEGSVDLLQRVQADTPSCSHGDKVRRAVRRLDKMLLRLQPKHKDRL